MSKLSIDLNCDMGESFGAWKMGNDFELMKFVSSVNIACGFHAGDGTVIRQTIQAAIENDLAIGAHPSFPDLQGFGRREMNLSEQEIFDCVLYQISALRGICESFGAKLHHVKPHGALYNQAAKIEKIAAAIVKAVYMLDESLIFYGLSGSYLITEAEKIGLKTASEAFADRSYQPDGALTPRNKIGALIEDKTQAAEQVLQIIKNQIVTAISGEKVSLKAETVCIHGDGKFALEFAKEIRDKLIENDILIKPL